MGNLANKKTSGRYEQNHDSTANPPRLPRLAEKDVVIPTTNKIYKIREWDVKLVRRLIATRALAPSFDGQTEKISEEQEECPICMLCYTLGLNRATCCKNSLCTECFLQINPQITFPRCPFCSRPNFSIKYTGPLTTEERDAIAQEQKKVDDLERKMREEEIERDRERERRRAEERERKAKQAGKEPEPAATDAPPPKSLSIPSPVPSPPPDANDEDSMMQEAIRLSLQLSKDKSRV